MIGEAILHLDRQCAAGRIEAEQRVVRHQGHARDRHLRDQVPIHDVAERFVDAVAVLIDGDPLRCARHRRGGKAAIVEIALELVAGLVTQGDKRQILHYAVQQRRRLGRTRSRAPILCTLDGTLSLSISAPAPGTGDTPTTSMVGKVLCAEATPGKTAQVKRSALFSALSLVKTSPSPYFDLAVAAAQCPGASNSVTLAEFIVTNRNNTANRQPRAATRDYSNGKFGTFSRYRKT